MLIKRRNFISPPPTTTIFCLQIITPLTMLRIHWVYPLQTDKTLNCIWGRGYNSKDLESLEYPSIEITPRSTVNMKYVVPWISNIDTDVK